MEVREKLKKERARLRLKMLSEFNPFDNVKIDNIPKERTKFPNTENDYWRAIDDGSEDSNSCLYELSVGSFFPAHLHEGSKETCTLMNEGAYVEFVTEDGSTFYSYPESFSVEKGVAHALVNKGEVTANIKVKWTPSMNGWGASFLNKND